MNSINSEIISGRIDDRRQMIVDLPFFVSPDATRSIQAQIDTGFNGHILMFWSDLFDLNMALNPVRTETMRLADGSTSDVHRQFISISWLGEQVEILAHVVSRERADNYPILLGVRLLFNCIIDMNEKNFSLTKKQQDRPWSI